MGGDSAPNLGRHVDMGVVTGLAPALNPDKPPLPVREEQVRTRPPGSGIRPACRYHGPGFMQGSCEVHDVAKLVECQNAGKLQPYNSNTRSGIRHRPPGTPRPRVTDTPSGKRVWVIVDVYGHYRRDSTA